jgi:hypothetical protein
MNYVGIDIHKRYSVLVAVDERGQELKRGRVNGNEAFGFRSIFFDSQRAKQSDAGSMLRLGPYSRSASGGRCRW